MRARRKARRNGLDSGVSVEALSITGLDVTATCGNGPCHANDVEEAMKASDAMIPPITYRYKEEELVGL